MRTTVPLTSAALAILLTVSLTACTPDDAALPTSPGSTASSAPVDEQTDEGVDNAPTEDDLPGGLGIVTCPEVIDKKKNTTDFDTQWKVTYACADRDAYDETVAALTGGFEHPVSESNSNDQAVSEWDHFIGTYGDKVTDIDLKLTGSPDELEMLVMVTIRN